MTLSPHEAAAPAVPARFAAAADAVRAVLDAHGRAGLVLSEVPAPRRLAPHALAVAAEVERDGEEVASGRFVVLHDPDGQEGWRGDTRVVSFVQADVEPEMAADPALAEVGWSWLSDALSGRGLRHTAAGGTVTRTVSVRFGQISEPDEVSEVEIRASWTPLPADGDGEDAAIDLAQHLLAFCDLLCATAGLPPPGVAALRPRA
ncbi:MAG TPA: DUF3000 domain-containing protein [Mycobacteriales bacterium]|nr:DUF3000 domain-containing protein [Mycobacteriales bacterium]